MESIWRNTFAGKKRPVLEGETEAEVTVIGAGMAGILTAWQLEQAGVRTVVLEAGRIGGGQTGNTTAKITSQHGLFCHSFLEKRERRPRKNTYRPIRLRWRSTKGSSAGKISAVISWKGIPGCIPGMRKN